MTDANNTALETLRTETEACISDLRITRGMKTCSAHDVVARGVIMLLRWQVASIHLEADHAKQLRHNRRQTILAVIAAAVALVAALLQH